MPSGRAVVLSDYAGGEGAASGGAGHAALDSFRALRAAGVDARLVTGFGAAPEGTGDRFRSLGGRDLRAGGSLDTVRAIYNPDARASLAAELRGEDPQTTLVILHQWTRFLSPAALALVDRFPTIIYMHDYFWACPNGAYFDFRQARPCDRQPMGGRCLLANCDRQGRAHKAGRVARQAMRLASVQARPERRLFLHLSERARRTAAPLLPGERHAVIHNPLDLPEHVPPPPEPARYAVGYFGRLEREKGVDRLADAVERLELTALFAGDGALAPEVVRHARIEHHRWAPRSAMAAMMRSCSVVVLPSLWTETWGLIVPEAMAVGVKVLVSARAGSAELVERFGGGAIFDPGAPGDLDRALAALLAETTPSLDRAGLRRALSPRTHAERLISLAAERFGLDLLARPDAVSETAASALPERRPAVLPPPPR